MPPGRSTAAALLQKVNSQLSGQRVPLKSKDEDELATYLNTLAQKTQQSRSVNFEDYGDISISSGVGVINSDKDADRRPSSPPSPGRSPASRFLKKKTPSEVAVSDSFKGKDNKIRSREHKNNDLTKQKRKAPSQTKSALVKADILMRAGQPSRVQPLSSRDSESESSFQGTDVNLRPGSADTSVGRDGLKFMKNQRVLSEDGKLAVRSPHQEPIKRNISSDKKSEQKHGIKHTDEIVRTLGIQSVTSDQDSLAEFIHGLSTSETSAKRPQNLVTKKQQKWRKRASSSISHSPSPVQESRSVSPFKRSKSPGGKISRSPSQESNILDSMDSEIVDERRDTDNSDDHFKVKLMDVASLLPSSPSPPLINYTNAAKHSSTHAHHKVKMSSGKDLSPSTDNVFKKKEEKRIQSPKQILSRKVESRMSLFDNLGVYMADDLLNFDSLDNNDAQLNTSEESEIKTESTGKQWKTQNKHHSITDIVTETNSQPRKQTSHILNSDEGNFRRRSPDLDDTDSEEYSDSFNSESETRSQNSSHMSSGRELESGPHVKHNSQRDRKIVMEETQVDILTADGKGATHQWNTTHTDVHVSRPYELQYVDPAPVATHVVSADTLEALTAYSPNMLALHEMMKAQLQLVQNFVDIQKRIYKSCMDGLSYDHKYTTLKDTKEYIRKQHKPRMTLKEALELVEQEEGITAA